MTAYTMTKKLKTYREKKTIDETYTIKEFKEKILPFTVRDTAVQREAVWDALKKAGYVSTAIVGSGKFTPIHICSLPDLLEVAIKVRDFAFIKRLEKFIEAGYLYAHLDGGNRCDTFVDFYDNLVKCEAADYSFLPVYMENEDGEEVMVEDAYVEAVETPMTYDELMENHPKIVEKMDNMNLIVFIYTDLSSEERADMFKMLNNGVNLNAAEFRNPSNSDVCIGIREHLNVKYKSLLIESGMITSDKAKRFGTCELMAKLATAFSDKSENPTVGGKKELDTAYIVNSICDTEFDKFNTFFETKFVPYLKIIKKEGYDLGKAAFFIDFFVLLKNLEEGDYKLPEINNASRDELINEIMALFLVKCANTKKKYKIKEGTTAIYAGLFSKTNSAVTKYRFKEVNKYYIPALIEKGIVVKTDPTRLYDKLTAKPKLFVKSGGKTTDGVTIKPALALNAKVFAADHSDLPWAKGGKTTVENGKLETIEYNTDKSDKVLCN
jgi:hypothetical protein